MKLCVNRFISVSVAVLICSALVVSCNKEETPGKEESKAIMFALPDFIQGFESKAIITNDNVSSTATIRVYAEKNAEPVTNLSPASISRQNTGFWLPSSKVLWDPGKAYTFQGYGYSKSGISGISSDGMIFTVAQPSSYLPDSMADYIVSNRFDVSASGSYNQPLVVLKFTHVLPAIEVFVTKAEAMKDVQVTQLTLSGLYYGAKMSYDSASGRWIPVYTTSPNVVCSIGSPLVVEKTREDTKARMSIVSVPQGIGDNTTLVISYKVDESLSSEPQYKEYSETFVLSSYAKELSSGNRAVFHLNVDTGIHLTASIVPWEKVDFIEGVILPPIL